MKIRVTMKDPDTLIDAIHEAVVRDGNYAGLEDHDEVKDVQERRKQRYHALAGTWFKYGEYLTVEIDTNAKTRTVLEAK